VSLFASMLAGSCGISAAVKPAPAADIVRDTKDVPVLALTQPDGLVQSAALTQKPGFYGEKPVPTTALTTRPMSVPSVPSVSSPAPSPAAAPCFIQPTEAEISLARQKSAFVYAVTSRAADSAIPLRAACDLVAGSPHDFPMLITAGKLGASALAGSKAWANFRGWAKLAGKDGANWRALLPSYRGSRDYVRPGPADFWTVLAQQYENQNKLSLQVAHATAGRIYRIAHPDADLPTYDQAKHYYSKHVDAKRLAIARHGEEYFRNNIAGHISREAPDPDEAWIGDHHKFDVAVRIYDQDKGKWIPVRPWLTAWLDWGSNYLVGGIIRAEDPNRDPIERALRDAVVKNGYRPPVRLYIDNGKDYKAMGFARLGEDDTRRVDTVAALLGCKAHFALPYNARAKVVERWFKGICESFSKQWASYIGNTPDNRPENFMALWNNPETLPTLDHFCSIFWQWLATIGHHTAGDGKALNGRTPAEIRATMRHPRQALAPEEVHLAFLRDYGLRKIARGGVVRVASSEYRSDELWKLLGNVDEVRVKLDPDDVSRAWCFLPDGRAAAVAEKIQTIPAFVDDDPKRIEDLRAQMKLNNGQQAAVRRESKEARSLRGFNTLPTNSISTMFGAGEQPASVPSVPVRSRIRAPIATAPASDIAELDALMRGDCGPTDDSPSQDDIDLLAAIDSPSGNPE
jgi:transposase InsO family protein